MRPFSVLFLLSSLTSSSSVTPVVYVLLSWSHWSSCMEAGLPLFCALYPYSHTHLCKHNVNVNTVVPAQLSKGRQELPPHFSTPTK